MDADMVVKQSGLLDGDVAGNSRGVGTAAKKVDFDEVNLRFYVRRKAGSDGPARHAAAR